MSDSQSIAALSDLGAFIRSRRKAQGLTQRELSMAAGVGLRFVIEVERGKPTSQIGKVFQLLQVLGVRLAASGAEPEVKRRVSTCLTQEIEKLYPSGSDQRTETRKGDARACNVPLTMKHSS